MGDERRPPEVVRTEGMVPAVVAVVLGAIGLVYLGWLLSGWLGAVTP